MKTKKVTRFYTVRLTGTEITKIVAALVWSKLPGSKKLADRLLSMVTIVLVCFALAACGSSPVQPETQQSASAPKFHAFGDSYTAGTIVDGDTAAGRKGYVAEISAHLGLPV